MIKLNKTGKSASQGVRLKPGRQWIAVANLAFSDDIQPRVKVDLDWCRELTGFLKDGSAFPPIKVFQLEDGTLLPGEGHHRAIATQQAGETDILCDVVNDTRERAIEHAALSNRGRGPKPMTWKDKTKALEMLLVLPEWRERSAAWIARELDCGREMVHAVRETLIRAGKVHRPQFVDTADGRKFPANQANGRFETRRVRTAPPRPDKGGPQSMGSFRGKRVYGKDANSVRAELASMQDALRARSVATTPRAICSRLHALGFRATIPLGAKNHYPGLGDVMRIPAGVCTGCPFGSHDDLILAIGRLVGARQLATEPIPGAKVIDHSIGMIVVCYVQDGPPRLIDLYRAAGFTFMTPEELVESLKAE